jgi:hypothetical protein
MALATPTSQDNEESQPESKKVSKHIPVSSLKQWVRATTRCIATKSL